MEVKVPDLRESNSFLNMLYNNLNSLILITNCDLKIVNFNNNIEVLYNTQKDEIIGQLCGNGLGCGFTVDEEAKCGETSFCSNCELRKHLEESFSLKKDVIEYPLVRDFYIDNKKFRKHLLYTVRNISYNEIDLAIIIINDITELEQKRLQIKEKNQEILESFRYAKRIQNAVLPDLEKAKEVFKDYFLIFKPKDIVSGDFYWYTKVNEIIIVVIADCTGHGVPGAFMSLLGVSALNEIINRQEVKNTAKVLDKLRTSIIDSLKQSKTENAQKDGMDMSIIAFNTKTNICQYTGANNPIWIVRNNNEYYENPIEMIEEFKCDKMPVAIYEKMDDFNITEFELNLGDKIYMFTDGFQDQFGGSFGKKIMSKQFKKLIAESSKMSMKNQKDYLEEFLIKWVNHGGKAYEQIDDITIMGIEI